MTHEGPMTVEERAFLHALAKERVYPNHGDVGRYRASVLVRCLESIPPSEPICECGASGPHQPHMACAPVEPKRERGPEPPNVEGHNIGRWLEAMLAAMKHGEWPIFPWEFDRALAAYRAEKAEWETRLADFKTEWSKAYDQLAEERAAHEELRRRVERAKAELMHVGAPRCRCSRCRAVSLLDGTEKAP